MEAHRIALPLLPAPGEVTSFYAYEGGAERSAALLRLGTELAERRHGSLPVLLIDLDLPAPGLHRQLGLNGEHDGVVEYFTACQEQLRQAGRHPLESEALAQRVLDSVDWRHFVERADQGRSLYVMRAGRMDEDYAERAAALDWQAAYAACPHLLHGLAQSLCHYFAHVLIDVAGGRSDLVAVSQALLPRKCVGVFAPHVRSLEGLAGMLGRVKQHRTTHEDDTQAFVLYPLPSPPEPAARALYQPFLEQMMEQAYGWPELELNSYLDAVEADPRSLLEWHEGDHMPWDSRQEVHLVAAVRSARAEPGISLSPAVALPLASALDALGQEYQQRRDALQAHPCFTESSSLRARLLGEDHPHTLAGRMHQAACARELGRVQEARYLYESVLDIRKRALGDEHPDTLAARAGLALSLAALGEVREAMRLHSAVLETLERQLGPDHLATLDAVAEHASLLAGQGEWQRARMLCERVLEGRQRLLGVEHEDALASSSALAEVLAQAGEVGAALRLQENVLAICRQRFGPRDSRSRAAQVTLARLGSGPDVDDTLVCVSETLVNSSNGILELDAPAPGPAPRQGAPAAAGQASGKIAGCES